MQRSVSYIDSFDLNDKQNLDVILGQTTRGTFAIQPESLCMDIKSLEKKAKGGGCFFCKTPDPDADVLKEYLSYDIDINYVDEGFEFDGVRRGIKCICGDCYEDLCDTIATTPEITVGIL